MRYMLSMSYGEAEPGVPPMSEWPTTDIKAHIESQRALPRCTGLVPLAIRRLREALAAAGYSFDAG